MLSVILVCQGCLSKGKKEIVEHTNSPVEQLFRDFANEKGTVRVSVGGMVMAFARSFADTRGVTGVKVYSFGECSQEVKDRLNEAIRSLKDNTYETLVSTSQDGERTKVLVKIKEDRIRELVVITGGSDPALVQIKGNIKPEDIESLIKEHQ